VEYARGPLPLSIPFGLADEFLSCLDFSTAGLTLGIYMSLISRHWSMPLPDGNPVRCPSKKVASAILGVVGPALTRLLQPDPATDEIPRG
jgi:hypothetical protein